MKKIAKLYFLEASQWSFYFQNKNSWHLQFSITQMLQLFFIIFEYLTYIGQPLLKLWAVELAILVHLIQLKQTKESSSKFANIYFWKVLSIAVPGESFKFFDPWTLKWQPFEIFAELNGKFILLAVFAKFVEYQTNLLTEIHNFA